ncbi:MAG TPA: TIGR02996 domain-containing protein [Gemmataceae bacterium]|nr:TIGR02996 domain-containing protein [Gemmataceae bacterium]
MPSLRDALEAALVEDPDDLATHRAYADYLQEQGDPRGEFIQVQLALEDTERTPEERQELERRERELLDAHGRKWLGVLADELQLRPVDDPWGVFEVTEPPYEIRFTRGWLNGIVLRNNPFGYGPRLSRLLPQASESRLLRELVLATVEKLIPSPLLANLRIFQLGETVDDYQDASNNVWCEDVPDFVATLPHLEILRLFAHGYDPAKLFALPNLTNLRVLQVYHLLALHPLEVLAENGALGQLTHLLLHPHASLDPLIDLASVRALLHSPHLRNLTHLQIRCSDLGDVGCTEIVTSGILKRLNVLDLRHGEITDAGARILADCPDLRRLERLDIARNGLTQTGIDALHRVLSEKLWADDQQSAGELTQRQYLYEGVFE